VTVYDGAGDLRTGGTFYNNRFLFTGRDYAATYAGTYTPSFNFYEYRARAYNPTLGRFRGKKRSKKEKGKKKKGSKKERGVRAYY
jgi:hypothetical protein